MTLATLFLEWNRTGTRGALVSGSSVSVVDVNRNVGKIVENMGFRYVRKAYESTLGLLTAMSPLISVDSSAS